jgi:endonuclease I
LRLTSVLTFIVLFIRIQSNFLVSESVITPEKSSTTGRQVDDYYQSAMSLTGDELHTELHNIIKNHTALYYQDTWEYIIDLDYSSTNSDDVYLFYSQRPHPSNDSDWSGNPIRSNDSWNREHIWPRAHGDFGIDEDKVAGTDLHNLRPTDKSVNHDRWDKDFDDAEIQHSECTDCYYSNNYWEPPDVVKGDVARTLFYMDVRYAGEFEEPDLSLFNGYTHSSVGVGTMGKLCTMYRWNVDDPVDSRELERNMGVYELQGNRNPFIENPNFVIDIWGGACDSDFDNDGLWAIEDPDDDNDGVIDAQDLCLSTAAGESVNADGCGLSELDSDGDGYSNDVDAFVNDATQWADSDGDGCGDNIEGNNPDALPNDPSDCADSDADGIGDSSDKCPGFDDAIDVDGDNIIDGCDELIDSDNDGIAEDIDECQNTPAGTETKSNGCKPMFAAFSFSNFAVIGLSISFLIIVIGFAGVVIFRANPDMLSKFTNKTPTETAPAPRPKPPKHWSDINGIDFRKVEDGPVQRWHEDENEWKDI